MKIAILSDIHGNLTALDTVYNDIKKRNIDEIILLGDLICDFPEPEKTLDIIYDMMHTYPTHIIRGNKEEYMLKEHPHWTYCSKNGSLLHSYKHLRKQDFIFLNSLPLESIVKPINTDAITMIHGHTIKNPMDYLQKLDTPVLLFGHSHERFVLEKDHHLILNPGSVGVSAKDTRIAEYALLEWNNDHFDYQMIDIKYDITLEKQRILDTHFIDESKYWGAATYKSLDTGKVETLSLITKAIELSNGNRPEEQHFEQAAKQLNIHIPQEK